MASKAPPEAVFSLRRTDRLLAFTIPLPPSPCLAVALYKPEATPEPPHDVIELARRTLVSQNETSSLLDCVLSSVRCGKNPILYLFLVTPHESATAALERLAKLRLDQLHLIQQTVVPLQHLSTAPSEPVAHFLEAVRSGVLSNISEAGATSPTPIRPQRLQDGFILERRSMLSDWASRWDGTRSRPIAHFHLRVQISYRDLQPSHLVIHAIPVSTPYCSLPSSPNPGSPIVLLPYGTPAYYLNTYNGPSNTLVKQFRDSLKGLGVGGWEDASRTPFIIGWIRVENRQGEDKGTLFIWPSRLCLSYSDNYNRRISLDYLPEMPAPLQSSPQVSQDSVVATEAAAEPLYADQGLHQAWPSEPHEMPPHTDPLRAFHNLTMSKSKDIRSLANEVGGYVDSVVRERERERERLKKEREAGTSISPRLSKNTVSTSVHARTPTSLPVASTSQILSQLPMPDPHSNLSHAHQAQIFYPSPPQSGQVPPPSIDNTSPDMKSVIDLPANQLVVTAQKAAIVPPTPSPEVPGNGFDPFNNVSSWPQPSDSYMDMGVGMDFTMDMDMDFGLEMNSSRSPVTATYTNHRPTLNFDDAFTDDDFSFFDQPSAPVPTPLVSVLPSIQIERNSSLPPTRTACPSPPVEEIRGSGPGPPLPLATTNTPWSPATQAGDGPTPQALDPYDSRAPDLIPSSPGQSPEPHSSPETPSVQLVFDSPAKPELMGGHDHGLVVFDPIPFSTSHKSNDTKYSYGKFALPSPVSEPGYDSPSPSPPQASVKTPTWYNVITDPRFGVVQQLIGVKRKGSPLPHTRNDSAGSAWLDVAEDEPCCTPDVDSVDAMDVSSDTDSDDENYESDCDSPQLSRPSTPAPSYLPLGPTLLHFRFDHAQLLPLSTPLRSPGAIVMPTTLTHFASVPTPVSPAAALGAASEQSKSLESAAFAIAAEFVENSLWAEAWKANSQRIVEPPAVWPDDIEGAADLLQRLHGLADLSTLFALDPSAKLELYDPPYISIGKGDAVIQLLPSALRFWEKLGLGPKGGKKDIEVYAFYEDTEDQKHVLVDTWLSTAATVYKARQMGQFVRGCTSPANDALLPIRFDAAFRKTLVSFISNITTTLLPIVVLLFVPVTAMTMASPILRQVLSSSKKALAGFSEGQIIFHLVPDSYLVDIEHSPKGYPLLDELCNSIYNRVHVSVERHLSRRMHGAATPINLLFHEPTFTLSRPLQSKVTYARSAHASLDVVDRFTLLHVGYQVSACKKWLLACCVDQRGEEYNLGLWLMHAYDEAEGESSVKGEEVSVVEKVWTFALDFARKANVEWRMVISKLGVMSSSEVQVWTDRIANTSNSADYAPLHIILASADINSPWTLIDSTPMPLSPTPRFSRSASSTKNNNHNTHFNDFSASFYALFPQNLITATTPPRSNAYSISLVSEPVHTMHFHESSSSAGGETLISSNENGEEVVSVPLHPIPFIPLSTSTLVRVPCQPAETPISMLHIHILKIIYPPNYTNHEDSSSTLHKLNTEVTRNFYELAILSTTRFRLDSSPILPFHLAAVDSMRSCLDCDLEYLESPIEP